VEEENVKIYVPPERPKESSPVDLTEEVRIYPPIS